MAFSLFFNAPKSFNRVPSFSIQKGVHIVMGFLNFLNKGKKQDDVRSDSLEIPPPPSMSSDSDFSDLPNFAEDTKDAEVPLPPLEPLEAMDSQFMAPGMELPEEKMPAKKGLFGFKKQPAPLGPEMAIPAVQNSQFDPFKNYSANPAPMSSPPFSRHEPKPAAPSFQFPEPKPVMSPFQTFSEAKPAQFLQNQVQRPIPAQKSVKFVRAEKFAAVLRNVDSVQSAIEINKSIASVRRIAGTEDREFDRFHKSVEDIQRNLVFVDQELFEEG